MEQICSTTPLFGQHHESNRLHNWALNRLQYRQDIHKDIQEDNIQKLTQDNLTLKFEITVRINNIIHNPLSLASPHLKPQKSSTNTIDTQKRQLDVSLFIIHTQDYHTHVSSKDTNFSVPSISQLLKTRS